MELCKTVGLWTGFQRIYLFHKERYFVDGIKKITLRFRTKKTQSNVTPPNNRVKFNTSTGHFPKEVEDHLKPRNPLKSTTDSLANRGFSKCRKPYKPPQDVEEQLYKICEEVLQPNQSKRWKETVLEDPVTKFKLLTRCIKQFNYEIPNSYLHEITSISHILKYFTTPVEGISPYEQLVRDSSNLPPNLYVIPDYLRFNPETDTFFGGISAFPGESTIVTGIKYKKKYKGFKAQDVWPQV